MSSGAPTDQRSARLRGRLEDVRLKRRHRGGDRRAREALIERYLPLARALAWRHRRGVEALDDLVQVASLGLVNAVDRWDPDRGLAFSSFAVPTIVGELRRYHRDATWTVRPPRGLLELSVSVEWERERRLRVAGREPTAADVAQGLGRSAEEVEEALQAAEGRSALPLDAPIHDDERDAATVGERIGRCDPGFDQAEARITVERLLSVLDDRARKILLLRFEDDLLQCEIAERMGMSQMHVSRIIRRSLDRSCAAAS